MSGTKGREGSRAFARATGNAGCRGRHPIRCLELTSRDGHALHPGLLWPWLAPVSLELTKSIPPHRTRWLVGRVKERQRLGTRRITCARIATCIPFLGFFLSLVRWLEAPCFGSRLPFGATVLVWRETSSHANAWLDFRLEFEAVPGKVTSPSGGRGGSSIRAVCKRGRCREEWVERIAGGDGRRWLQLAPPLLGSGEPTYPMIFPLVRPAGFDPGGG